MSEKIAFRLYETEYVPETTGVGCAEHNDPECLCDVIVSDPVPIRFNTSEVMFGSSAHAAGGDDLYDWACLTLGAYDAFMVYDAERRAAEAAAERYARRADWLPNQEWSTAEHPVFCVNGHEYTYENTYINRNKETGLIRMRGCRICRRKVSSENYHRRQARKKAQNV